MMDVSLWMKDFLIALDSVFAERVWFVGLQGSYARDEATEESDLDVVVILDKLSLTDLDCYRSMLDSLSHREKICGFFSGKGELLAWEPSDLFQFYHDTKPIRGSLDELLPLIDADAVKRAIKIGACNVYHGCVHNLLHERSPEILKGLCKSATFVMQALVFARTGCYIRRLTDLLPSLTEDERMIAESYLAMKRGQTVDFDCVSESVLLWARIGIES